MKRTAHIFVVSICASVLLAACGLKGPLKLPNSSKPAQSPTAGNPAQPATNSATTPPAPVGSKTSRPGQSPTDSPGSTTGTGTPPN